MAIRFVVQPEGRRVYLPALWGFGVTWWQRAADWIHARRLRR